MPWSDEARVLVRPFRAYAALAAAVDPRPAQTLAMRVAFFLFTCGAFVSLTTAGRLVGFHVVSTMAFWAFIPAVQAGAFLVALRLVGAHRRTLAAESLRPPAALALYFAGHGPWLLFFTATAGVCLFAPDVHTTMMGLLRRGVLPALFLTTIVWSGVLTYACFRSGLSLSRARAGRATAIFYLGFSAVIVGYYLAMNEIQPQLPWAP